MKRENKKKLLRVFAGVLIGAVLGYVYYRFVGCNNGCTLTSDPLISTIYGASAGLVMTVF